ISGRRAIARTSSTIEASRQASSTAPPADPVAPNKSIFIAEECPTKCETGRPCIFALRRQALCPVPYYYLSMHLPSDAPELYLDQMKRCPPRYTSPNASTPLRRPALTLKHAAWILYPPVAAILKRCGLTLFHKANVDLKQRAEGRDWPADAETMIGLKR